MLALLALFLQSDLVERYLAESDGAKRSAILAQLKGSTVEAVEEAIRTGGAWPAGDAAGKVLNRTSKTEFGDHEFRWQLYVPEKYEPSKAWRLIVSLHGTNGEPDQMIRAWQEQARAEGDLFVLAPGSRKYTWGGPRQGLSIVMSALKEATRDFRIDPDRVVLDGMSMGGIGTFVIAMAQPDRWAAIAPRAQGPPVFFTEDASKKKTYFCRGPENLKALPLYWVFGQRDDLVSIDLLRPVRKQFEAEKIDAVYQEHAGGHEWVPEETPKVAEWMRKRARNPYAEEIAYATVEKLHHRAYWIDIEKMADQKTYRMNHMTIQNEIGDTRDEFYKEVRVRAKLDRAANRVDVRTENVKELTVYLHDRMLDLAKPVEIVVNGKSVKKAKVDRSIETLLESARLGDRGRLYTARVRITVP